MLAAIAHRRPLLLLAALAYGGLTAAFALAAVPPAAGHGYYLAIALLALATGPFVGAAGGALAILLCALAVVVTGQAALPEIVTLSTGFVALSYATTGTLIGWFARTNRRSLGELRELAERDFLTGLLNMRAFEASLARRCRREGTMALVLCDLDDLKLINDREGHARGNEVLQAVARTLAGAVRPGDEIARIGGDEFAVVAEAAGAEEAEGLVHRLAAECRRRGLGVSFGAAAYPEEGGTPLALFRCADERLYAAKLRRPHVASPRVRPLRRVADAQ